LLTRRSADSWKASQVLEGTSRSSTSLDAERIAAGLRALPGVVLTSTTIGNGQTFSLLLTLLAVPVAYSILDDLSLWLRHRFFARTKIDRGECELE
jgi:hypothetical protein